MPDQNSRLIDVEKQVAANSVLVAKFDAALDKISEVSLNVSKLLAVHEQRLEVQEEATRELPLLLEQRRVEVQQAVDSLGTRLTSSEQELRKEMTNGQKEILNEIKNLRTDVTNQTDALKTELSEDLDDQIEKVDERISKLERFVYIAIGGVTVISFAIGEAINWLSNTHK